MDELVDELSGTTLDGDANNNKDFPMKAKNNKPNRTASIINRSKLLMLSDSDSDEDEEMSNFDKRRCSKHIRISKQKGPCIWRPKSSSYCKMLAKGKRKRNSTTETLATSSATLTAASSTLQPTNNLFAAGPSGLQNERANKLDSMDVECDQYEDSDDDSDLSDHSEECNFDGDDEQSDFYDSSATANPPSEYRQRIYCHSRNKLEFKIPTNPSNPFWSVVDLEPHHSSSINLWKRRRQLKFSD